MARVLGAVIIPANFNNAVIRHPAEVDLPLLGNNARCRAVVTQQPGAGPKRQRAMLSVKGKEHAAADMGLIAGFNNGSAAWDNRLDRKSVV